MASCCEAPKPSQTQSRKGDISSSSDHKNSGLTAWVDSFAPVLSALLHSSCCWLPVRILLLSSSWPNAHVTQTLLDLTSIGSASAATVSNLRPVFLTITVLVLFDSIRRQGFNRHNLLRIVVSTLVLCIPRIQSYYQQAAPVDTPKHSCH